MSDREALTEPIGRVPLLEWTVCPNCWQRFQPHEVLFVARHQGLVGDPVAGAEAYLRFRPSRFAVDGAAIDPEGLPCHQIACPQCHLELSRALLELKPLYVSIVGTPASGKSYYLGSMTWQMRRTLPGFGLAFNDADPELNGVLHQYEHTLFLSNDPDRPVAIRKTEVDGSHLYRSVVLSGQPQLIPRPFQFTLTQLGPGAGSGRVLVLYDNAGEHFLPGQDLSRAPVTRHLAKSQAIIFVFDPTQDPRFRQHCGDGDPQLRFGHRLGLPPIPPVRQETVLNETAMRVRRYRGISHRTTHDQPLVVVLAKADIWLNRLLNASIDGEPIVSSGDGLPSSLAMAEVEAMSSRCRGLLRELCPEFVAAAESFCRQVIYLPVSALGRSPELVEEGEHRFYGIRPGQIRPSWVTAPMLYTLQHAAPALFDTSSRRQIDPSAEAPS